MTAHVPALMPALPELLLASGALLLVLIGALRGESSHGFVRAASVLLLGLALWAVCASDGAKIVTFNGAFIMDGFARFMKAATLLSALAALVMSQGYLQRHKAEAFEYPLLVLLSTTGMLVMISAHD